MTDLELREAVAVKVTGLIGAYTGKVIDGELYGNEAEKRPGEDFYRWLHRPVPAYESDIAAAWLVVEKMRQRGWSVVLNSAGHTAWTIQIAGDFPKPDTQFGEDGYMSINAPSAPLAICRAALAAMEASDGR